MAWLGARGVERLLERGSSGWRLALAASVLVVFCVIHVGRTGAGVARNPNAWYWEVVGWMRKNVPADDRVVAAPSIKLSLPQQGHDFFRLIVPYEGPHR